MDSKGFFMKHWIFAAAFAALWCLPPALLPALLPGSLAAAHEGHDHSQPPPALVGVTLSPRMEARSADFELVAAVENGALVVWLDRAISNQPVSDAMIEVEGGVLKGVMSRAVSGKTATPDADVSYTLPTPALTAPGDYPLVFAITTPDGGDLLNGTLTIPAPVAPSVATLVSATPTVPPPMLLMVVVLALGFGLAWWYRRKASRSTS
jgi:hypothetical protein